MFVSIIGVLTDAEEKKRYDQHLQQFGSDENFSSNYYFEAEVFARMEESVKLERIARIEKVTVKISEKEDEIDGVEEKEIAKLKIIYKERRILRYVALLTRKWNCDFCGRTYPSLIQYKEKIAVGKEFDCKFCLACFAYVQGKLVGQGEKEQTTRLMKIIKKIEDEFEEAKGFCFVSYRITS
jgi:hypothetical protein